MHLKKTYTFMLIYILNVVLLHAKEDFSIYVKLKDYNITDISQLISTDPEKDMGKFYYLPIDISLVNNTNKRKHLEMGGICEGLRPWGIKGYLRFTIKAAKCRSIAPPYEIWLKPKEAYSKTFHLVFPLDYLNKKIYFSIGFTEFSRTIGAHAFKEIATYWSKRIIINKNAKAAKDIIMYQLSSSNTETQDVPIIKKNLSIKDIPLKERELMEKSGSQKIQGYEF